MLKNDNDFKIDDFDKVMKDMIQKHINEEYTINQEYYKHQTF